ncbi:hypothetical protein VNO80_23396 [Phaseolus coccineus]|uniref:BHLH domain-containing protein n=1 Tax=Phaseolus coccineus TaxID=3886 RepID=A0AAN9M9J1_PHACN
MDFLLENHTSSSSSDRSSEITKNETLSKQQGEILMNKTSNQDIFEKNEKKIVISGEGSYDLEMNDEMHPSIERGRRKKMKGMFDDLSGLLPQLPSKVDKASIVNEAVNYIKVLQETLEKLERKKQERAEDGLKQIMGTTSGAVSVSGKQKVAFHKTWAASNMVLNIHGNEAQFSICTVHKPGLMTNIASVLEKHNIELISATISANGNGSSCMIQVHGKQGWDENSVEETYRKAAEEIMPLIA